MFSVNLDVGDVVLENRRYVDLLQFCQHNASRKEQIYVMLMFANGSIGGGSRYDKGGLERRLEGLHCGMLGVHTSGKVPLEKTLCDY